MKIALFIDTMGIGGAQTVLSLLGSALTEEGHEVSLTTLSRASDDQVSVDSRVERHSLDLLGSNRGRLATLLLNGRRVIAIRRHLELLGPDVAISFMQRMNVLVLASARRTRTPVITSDRTNPLRQETDPILGFGVRRLYPRASAIVAQTVDAAEWAGQFVPAERVHIVPNPVDPALLASPRPSARRLAIAAAGRLTPEKGFDRLIRAIALSRLPESWTVEIHGEGPTKPHLHALIAELDLSGQIFLPGAYRTPVSTFGDASIFALPSRWEGFPNVVLEAMALGVPIVAFDCRNGPSEIIRHGVDGLLVPEGDVEGLAQGLAQLIEHPPLRERMGSAARERAEDFELSRVLALWHDVVNSASLDRDQR